MILTLWPVYAGEITRAAAYSLTAIGVCRLFRRPMAASLGNARWYFVALLAAVAGLQFVMLAGSLRTCREITASRWLLAWRDGVVPLAVEFVA